jgi:hypothetical protein
MAETAETSRVAACAGGMGVGVGVGAPGPITATNAGTQVTGRACPDVVVTLCGVGLLSNEIRLGPTAADAAVAKVTVISRRGPG